MKKDTTTKANRNNLVGGSWFAVSSPVDTAKAEIMAIIQDRDLGPKGTSYAIQAVLEALVEDTLDNANLERKVRP